jgi:hypothetical protein
MVGMLDVSSVGGARAQAPAIDSPSRPRRDTTKCHAAPRDAVLALLQA